MLKGSKSGSGSFLVAELDVVAPWTFSLRFPICCRFLPMPRLLLSVLSKTKTGGDISSDALLRGWELEHYWWYPYYFHTSMVGSVACSQKLIKDLTGGLISVSLLVIVLSRSISGLDTNVGAVGCCWCCCWRLSALAMMNAWAPIRNVAFRASLSSKNFCFSLAAEIVDPCRPNVCGRVDPALLLPIKEADAERLCCIALAFSDSEEGANVKEPILLMSDAAIDTR